MSDELKIAIEAAEKGAEEALTFFNKPLDVTFKEDRTPITVVDTRTEEVIRSYIRKKIRGSKFVGEEGGGNKDLSDFWTIDPIDGTRSFSRGVPGWCVLISHYTNSKFKIGVCYFPVYDQMLYAELGMGAHLNKKRVRVSQVDKISEAFTAFGNPKYIENKDIIFKLVEKSAATRSWESTYSLFLVAQGKADVLVDGYRLVWDNGPFVVIMPEAGGKITGLDGNPIDLKSKGCIATNGILHDEVVRLYNA